MTVVIGAGPAGLLAAKEMAKEGHPVKVYEEHEKIGLPMHCTGLISKKGLDLLDVNYKEVVMNKCKGARIFSPGGEMLEVKRDSTEAVVVSRSGLDQLIAEEAQSEGAEIIYGKRWKDTSTNETVVAADGPTSIFALKMGYHRQFYQTYQVLVDLERDLDFVELHFGSFAPGLFAWIVPESENQCRVGLGYNMKFGQRNPKLALAKFLHNKGLKLNYEPASEFSALIPMFDGKPAIKDNVALVGDAAAQVKATTGGGIVIGGFCARIAGRVIAENQPLTEYERVWRKEFGPALEMHLRIRKTMDNLPESTMDELVVLGKEEGIEKTISQYGEMENPLKLVSALSKNTKLIMRAAKYIKYIV